MPDVFISYAHVDDQSFTDGEKGWVTYFVNHLNTELSRRLGRKEYFELWKDFRLRGSDAVTPTIEKQVSEASVLLILFSPGWLESTWCQNELQIFCESHVDVRGRIFVVELDRIAMEDKPTIMKDLLNYPFWRQTDQEKVRQLGYPVPKGSDTAYFERLVDLSHDLASTLKFLQPSSPKPEPPKATVYVAPVPDSLYDQRAGLISELRQYKIAALPRNNEVDLRNFAEAMERDLAMCSHFVQLLDENYTLGIPANQYLVAETTGKPVLQWRSRSLDTSKANHEQKALIEGRHVIACNLSEFTRHIVDAVLPKPKEEQPQVVREHGQKMIFIHAGQQDFNWAESVADTLRLKGFGIALPRYSGDSAGIRKSIERGLVACNVLLMLHRETPAEVVEDFLSEAHLRSTEHHKDVAMLVCQGCGAEKLYFHPPRTRLLTCRNELFGQHCVEQFLQEVVEA